MKQEDHVGKEALPFIFIYILLELKTLNLN